MLKPLVIDSSVASKWLLTLDELYIKQADKILHDAQQGKWELYMPSLAKYEIGNVLVRKKVEYPLIEMMIEDFYSLPITFIEEDVHSAERSLDIAKEFEITYYDATFISLAEYLKAPLITANPKHQKKYKGKVKVIDLKDYK